MLPNGNWCFGSKSLIVSASATKDSPNPTSHFLELMTYKDTARCDDALGVEVATHH